ncbi:hypothetical protein [Roseateles sp.]|nr:hypothetical protein [Roseateles sp.]
MNEEGKQRAWSILLALSLAAQALAQGYISLPESGAAAPMGLDVAA